MAADRVTQIEVAAGCGFRFVIVAVVIAFGFLAGPPRNLDDSFLVEFTDGQFVLDRQNATQLTVGNADLNRLLNPRFWVVLQDCVALVIALMQ